MTALSVAAGGSLGATHAPLSLEESLTPYRGPVKSGVDHSTLHGTVMCGYQGWFSHRDDGNGLGNVHWGDVQKRPPRCTVDLWPDMSELSPSEKFPTNYKHADGSTAYVFSSTVRPTVLRHFRWMRDYGIHGVWVQRFANQLEDARRLRRVNTVLSHCREGANGYGRSFAVMYDADFDRSTCRLMAEDWTKLLQRMQLFDTPAYQRHAGKPVVGLWGFGFEHRRFDASGCAAFLGFLKSKAGGECAILAGVPNDWRSWERGDDTARARIRLLREYIDIVQPWNVGRYRDPNGATRHFAKYVPGDMDWCRKHGKDYYAVVFPGFSWTNLKRGKSPINSIPRLGGRFLWRQAELVKEHGMDMAYIAMFDEVDEGTAIFKCTNNPPVGRFVTYEGYPCDHYLRLSGLIQKMLRGEAVAFPGTRPDARQMTYEPMSTREYYNRR